MIANKCSGEENCRMIRRLRVSILTRDTFDIDIDQRLLKEWWFDPWQDYFNYFRNSMYKLQFDKSNIELWKTHLVAISRICRLQIRMSNIHKCVVPGPASQDAVIECVYASPGLQCMRDKIYLVTVFKSTVF